MSTKGAEVKPTKPEYANKHPGVNYAPKDTNSEAVEGEKAATTGFLGLGKSMIACRTNPSEEFIDGKAPTDGIEAIFKNKPDTACYLLVTAP